MSKEIPLEDEILEDVSRKMEKFLFKETTRTWSISYLYDSDTYTVLARTLTPSGEFSVNLRGDVAQLRAANAVQEIARMLVEEIMDTINRQSQS